MAKNFEVTITFEVESNVDAEDVREEIEEIMGTTHDMFEDTDLFTVTTEPDVEVLDPDDYTA